MRTLYFDCFAGVSGNMILGGLLGLGVDKDRLMSELRTLTTAHFDLRVEAVDRSGIAAVHVEVMVPKESSHRHLSTIEEIIDRSAVSEGVKERSKAIFHTLAAAEAKVHGIDIRQVHFHEVGAMDAIIDIVGSCIGFELLGIEHFACSKIHVGSGFVEMQHGKFPVPPPAVAELLSGVPFYSSDIPGELTTPTGAAIVTTVCTDFGPANEMVVDRIGYGAGTRTYEKFPNAVRLMLGDTARREDSAADHLLLIETNIDDQSPQITGFVLERALELGALDCWLTPIQMKKNRPAVMLSILCDVAKRGEMTELIYKETTTLGIRVREVDRDRLEREVVTVETEFGPIDVKIGKLDGRIVNIMPEYDQVRRAALENGVAFRIVRNEAITAFDKSDARHAAAS